MTTPSYGIHALTKALKGADILTDDHLLLFVQMPIPTRGQAIPGWLLQLSHKKTGAVTRFYLCGIPASDSPYKVIQFSSLFGVTDPEEAALALAIAFDLGAVLPKDADPS